MPNTVNTITIIMVTTRDKQNIPRNSLRTAATPILHPLRSGIGEYATTFVTPPYEYVPVPFSPAIIFLHIALYFLSFQLLSPNAILSSTPTREESISAIVIPSASSIKAVPPSPTFIERMISFRNSPLGIYTTTPTALVPGFPPSHKGAATANETAFVTSLYTGVETNVFPLIASLK